MSTRYPGQRPPDPEAGCGWLIILAVLVLAAAVAATVAGALVVL